MILPRYVLSGTLLVCTSNWSVLEMTSRQYQYRCFHAYISLIQFIEIQVQGSDFIYIIHNTSMRE